MSIFMKQFIFRFPFTITVILIILSGIAMYLVGNEFVALHVLGLSCTLAFGAALSETKYNPPLMYGITYVSCFIAGLLADLHLENTLPYYSISMLFWINSAMFRHVYLVRLGLLTHRWIEFTSWLIGAAFFLIAPASRDILEKGIFYFSNSISNWIYSHEAVLFNFSLFGMLMLGYAFFKHYYDYVQSKPYYANEGAMVGKEAPNFQLPDEEGRLVNLHRDYKGKKPVLLFFTRGDWCPYCHIMLRAYERAHALFNERGIEVLSINPDPEANNRYKKETLRLHYRLLYDPNLSTAELYGFFLPKVNPAAKAVSNLDRGVPLPAAILIDKQGIIRYISRSDKVDTLNPEFILKIVETL